MPNVSNLKVLLQQGTDSTYYATWDFKETIKKNTSANNSNGIKTGDWVTIQAGVGATYYNGVAIPSWVMNETWEIIQITNGDRAVLGRNKNGGYNIVSPISTKYLSNGSTSSEGSTTEVTETTNYLDHYEVDWHYATGDGVWFEGTSSDNVKKAPTLYNAPANAYKIKVTVKPVSQTHKVNEEDVAYWTGSPVSQEYFIASNPPAKPDAPNVTIEKMKLTASLENISDEKADQIQFEVYSGTKRVNTGIVTVSTCRATFVCTISVGADYRVRCRAINLYGDTKVYGEWSSYSNSAGTIPAIPKKIVSLKALSETSVYVEWEVSSNAKSYKIEYTTKRTYFDSNSSEVKSVTVEAVVNHAEITGMETGLEYFFRVRAVNDIGDSDWSEIKSLVIGKTPAAPTTWSSSTTVITGEPLTLYWVHNSEDNSSQTYAEVELYIDGVKETHTVKNTTDEDERDKTSFYAVNTSSYKEGTTIQWRVRTAGITKTYGDWSVQRIVDVYAQPTVELSITEQDGAAIETLNSFPFYISALAGPKTQTPIGYHLTISSNSLYETVDNIGNVKMVNKNEAVYSKYFDISDPLLIELSANNIDLKSDIEYTVTCTVSMNSGLSASATLPFSVHWNEVAYEPDAEIGVDRESYIAYISPYCITEDGQPNSEVLLSVYRREFDGSYSELASGIDTASNTYITDPHPSLDYARYRIVATSKSTGAVSYYDPPGYPVGGKAVIIQWNDEWSNFDAAAGDELEQQPWIGSMLKLPYNIDVSDDSNSDVTLVNYIGRSHPVSYYGTHVGFTSVWNVEIPKRDKNTLYALRRLSAWMGDVYVREPSGSGYWASIKVSYNQKHRELTIPVTLNITRVEGGI